MYGQLNVKCQKYIIRIYHDVRSTERQMPEIYYKNLSRCTVNWTSNLINLSLFYTFKWYFFCKEFRRFSPDAQRDPRTINSALSYGNEFLVYFLFFVQCTWLYQTRLTLFHFLMSQTLLPLRCSRSSPTTHSHVQPATSLHGSSPFPRDDQSTDLPPPPTAKRHTNRTTFSTLQLILLSSSWQHHTNLKRRCALYWSIWWR